MSLINEALKKAQRARHQPAPDLPAAAAGAPAIAKRATPMRAQTVLIAFAAAAALIVISVVITVYLLNRPAPSSAPLPPVPASTPGVDLNAPSPVIVAPPLAAPLASVEPASQEPREAPSAAITPSPAPTNATAASTAALPNSAPAVLPPTPAATQPPGSSTSATRPAASPAPAVTKPAATGPKMAPAATPAAAHPTPPPAEPKPDPQILAYIDGLKVTGIRYSGADSKVLMNDRVYRVNDLVERTLGVKLTKVAPDALTFTDANGFVYTKNF